MAGLLENNVGDFIKGAGTAALMGANPLLGLLAGGAIKNNRMKREAENKMLRDRMTATDELTGLLNSKTTTAAPTVGPSKVVEGLPGMFEPFAIPGKRGEVPTVQTPEGQQQLLGIMSKLNPGATGASLLPKQNARTNTMAQRIGALQQEALRRGLSPEETNAFIDANLSSGSFDPMAMLAGQMQEERLAAQRLANEEAQKTAEREADERRRGIASQTASLRSTLRGIDDLAKNNEFLAGTILRPGWAAEPRKTGLSAWETAKRAFGGDTATEQQLLQSFGDFEKGAANLLNDLLPQLEGINANTDNRLAQIRKSLADVGNEPGTNAKILSETIYDLLDIATIEGFEIPNEQKWLSMAENLRSFGTRNKVGRFIVEEVPE